MSPGDPAFASNHVSTVYAGFPATSPPFYAFVDSNSGSYTATYSTVVGIAGNGVPVGATSVSVTVKYSYRGNTKSVTLSGFKVTV